MDNLDNVPSSEVTSETVSFLYGKLAADKHAFESMESIDIVKSVFGIEAMNPSHVDIVEAIVKNMPHDDQVAIRTRISDRSVVGEIWNFTTPRMFMIKLSKEPLGSGSFEFTLTLITKYVDGDGTEIYVRPLVTFGQGTVRFQSPRLKRIEFSASSVEWLQKIHDEAVAKLEQKLVTVEPKEEVKEELPPSAEIPVDPTPAPTPEPEHVEAPTEQPTAPQEPPKEEVATEPKEPLISAGKIVNISLNKRDRNEVIIHASDLLDDIMRFTNEDFYRVYNTGFYRANCDIFAEDFKNYEQLHELMDKFDIVVEPTPEQPIPQSKETPTMSQTDNQATTVVIPSIVLEFNEGCNFDSEYRATLTKAANDAIRGQPNENITEKLVTDGLREIVENDNINLKFVSEMDGVFTFIASEEKPAEEVPSVDINNVEVQTNLLRGIFGVSDPAITHVQKFLKNHLTEEGNSGFLATGTFPTETTIVYTEKPYDVTICIVKHMDGAFYRIQLARTNLGLKDHGYIATKDVPGRWVKIGRDIQDVNRRSSGYSFRPRR